MQPKKKKRKYKLKKHTTPPKPKKLPNFMWVNSVPKQNHIVKDFTTELNNIFSLNEITRELKINKLINAIIYASTKGLKTCTHS